MNACCEDQSNRVEGPGPRGMDGVEPRPDLRVTHCSVCEARHFEVEADPAVLGLRGARL
jgi:hypothetical protein